MRTTNHGDRFGGLTKGKEGYTWDVFEYVDNKGKIRDDSLTFAS